MAFAFNKPLPNDDAAAPAPEFFPNSRRDTANAAHINGPAPGTSPPAAPRNHDNKPPPTPLTDPEPATTGADAATGTPPDAATLTTGSAAAGATDTRRAGAETAAAGAGDTDAAPARTDSTTTSASARAGTGALTDEPDMDDVADGASLDEASSTSPALIPSEDLESAEGRRVDDRGASSPALSSAVRSPIPRTSRDPDPERRDLPSLFVDDAPDDEPAAPDPVDPAEPVVSANATGIAAAAAEPIPNATAKAPTRPTNRARLLSAAGWTLFNANGL